MFVAQTQMQTTSILVKQKLTDNKNSAPPFIPCRTVHHAKWQTISKRLRCIVYLSVTSFIA